MKGWLKTNGRFQMSRRGRKNYEDEQGGSIFNTVLPQADNSKLPMENGEFPNLTSHKYLFG